MAVERSVIMGKKGRPKSDVVRERIVTIRMSEEEYHALKEYSDKHQQTITRTIKTGIDLLYKIGAQGDFLEEKPSAPCGIREKSVKSEQI